MRAQEDTSRRTVFGWLATAAALVLSYGTFAAFLGGFLHRPSGRRRFVFVGLVADLDRAGGSLVWRTPAGAPVNVARLAPGDSGLVALSSTCPHLGCQVHYQPQHRRFFCPCHNGVFTPDGRAIAGPPAKAGQSLLRYRLRVENGALFLELPQGEA